MEKNKNTIDAQTGALLIDMLFKQQLINEKTYNNIQAKYNQNGDKKAIAR